MSKNEALPANLLEWPVAMLRIAPPSECEELSGTDWDTLERNHKDKVVRTSARRVGMRVGHVLMLATA
jgi:hypothetical protein